MGGDLLQTEVAVTPGKGKLVITGQLGEVMQESAQAAMSYVRSRAKQLGLVSDFYSKVDIHVHVPEGAIAQGRPDRGHHDGHRASRSALTRVPVKSSVAMTGEITLRGRVLPIGGLKEKLIAAHRGGIKTVVIPKENEKDLKEMPVHIKRGLTLIPVEHMDQVLGAALAIADVAGWLRPGEVVIESIFEGPEQAAGSPAVN